MIIERKKLKYAIFKILIESFDDKTRAIIPHDLSDKEKDQLISKYDKESRDWDVQSNPNVPNPGLEQAPWEMENEEIIKRVLRIADHLSSEIERKSKEKREEEARRREEDNLAFIEKLKQQYKNKPVEFESTGVVGGQSPFDFVPDNSPNETFDLPLIDDYDPNETTLRLDR